MSESTDPVYLRDLPAAGYSVDEVRSWGVAEFDDGEPYHLRADIAP
jgi:hypothetical protein